MEKFNVDSLLESIFTNDSKLVINDCFEQKLIEYNITKTKALKYLNIDKDVFEQIINGNAKQPNLIHIIKIAEFLEVEIDKFVKIVLGNQSLENIASIDKARNTTFLLKNFDVKTLTKLGFFDKKDSPNILVQKVLTFFGYRSISEFEDNVVNPLYSKTKRTFSDKMKRFWVESAYQTFINIDNPNRYDRNKLKELIVKIKPYSQDAKNGLYTVCKALYNVGVTVILQDYLTTTQIRGGTFVIKGKPCVVITDFNKSYPSIWFTLLHELYHVLFDFEVIENNNFHLTGEPDLFLIEEKADSFSRDFFLSEPKFHYIKNYINNDFIVAQFAKENEIEVSIVYSFFTWYQDKLYGKNYYGAFKNHYPSSREAIVSLNPIAWDIVRIKDVSDRIKSILEI
jgi:Zn-dependent peptidase ImmA (M78 family)